MVSPSVIDCCLFCLYGISLAGLCEPKAMNFTESVNQSSPVECARVEFGRSVLTSYMALSSLLLTVVLLLLTSKTE